MGINEQLVHVVLGAVVEPFLLLESREGLFDGHTQSFGIRSRAGAGCSLCGIGRAAGGPSAGIPTACPFVLLPVLLLALTGTILGGLTLCTSFEVVGFAALGASGRTSITVGHADLVRRMEAQIGFPIGARISLDLCQIVERKRHGQDPKVAFFRPE